MSAAADIAAKSRREQGLPAKVTDPAALARIASLLKHSAPRRKDARAGAA